MKHLKNKPMQPSCNNDQRKKERKKENEGVHKKEEDEVSYESVGVRTEKGAVFSGNEGLVLPGGGSQACDPNSQSSRPLVFTSLFIYLFILFIIFLPKNFN